MPGAFQGGGSPWHKGRKALQSLKCFLFLSPTPPSPQHTQNDHSLELRKLKVLFRKKKKPKNQKMREKHFPLPVLTSKYQLCVYFTWDVWGLNLSDHCLDLPFTRVIKLSLQTHSDNFHTENELHGVVTTLIILILFHVLKMLRVDFQPWSPILWAKFPASSVGASFTHRLTVGLVRKTSLNSIPKCIKVFQGLKSWLGKHW